MTQTGKASVLQRQRQRRRFDSPVCYSTLHIFEMWL